MNVIQGPKPCDRIRPMLQSYISNELLVETTHEVMRHLEVCPDCRFELEQHTKARTLLRSAMNHVEAPPDLRVKIRASLDQPAATASWFGWRFGAMQTAAAIGMVLFSGLLFQLLVRDPSTIAGLLNLGWDQHVRCTLAGHYSAEAPDHARMVHDLGPRYESLLPVVDRKLPEYRIRKAHLCHQHGREFAHLILQHGDSIVSVSLIDKKDSGAFPTLSAVSQKLFTAAKDKGEMAAFQTSSHVVFVMGNTPPPELNRLARMFQAEAAGAGY